jgi:amino acid adenylation domain-containing protein
VQAALLSRYPGSNVDRHSIGLTPRHLLYVIYTSGSTGRPKGVLVEHHTVVNFLYYSLERFMPQHLSGSLVSAPLAFDGTVCPLYTPLLAGKYVKLLPGPDTDLDLLCRHVFESTDELLFKLTPSHLEALLGQEGTSARAARHVFVVAGELLTQKTLAPWRDELFAQSEFFNEYGPTEASVGTTVYRAARGRAVLSGSGSVPIGEPLANARLYVLNTQMQLQPVGTPGELYIGGAGVARGYLNQPELTQRKFVHDPFSSEPGQRLYRTGDWVRWLSDGTVEFLGRIDEQVKLRGYRIELGEIEHQISQLAGVQASVVLCREDEGQEKRLVAYVLPSKALEAEDEEQLLEQKRARVGQYVESLKGKLPHYMVPGVYVFMEQFPLSPNGKIDRRRLPPPGEGDLQKRAYVAPRDEIEAQLCQIWQDVLGLQQVSIHDDFFALGGHSLLATRLISLVRERFDSEVPLRYLFDNASVARFSTAINMNLRLEKLARNKARMAASVGEIVEGQI